MRIQTRVAACAIALAALPVGAQTLKPGLWEIHNKVNNADMAAAMPDMQKQLAQMPPEQRKQMEAMLAQQGVRMAPGAGGAMAIQMCMTKEMVERDAMPMEEGCRTTKQQRTGNTMRVAFTCTRPPSSGEGQITIASPESYSSHMTVKVQDQGRTQTTTMDASGKWLKADCGNVKPIAPRRK